MAKFSALGKLLPVLRLPYATVGAQRTRRLSLLFGLVAGYRLRLTDPGPVPQHGCGRQPVRCSLQ